MNKRKTTIFMLFVLMVSMVLAGCSISMLENFNKNDKVGIPTIDNVGISDSELEPIDKTIMDKEEFEAIYKDNPEMLSYIDEFVGKPAPDFKVNDLEGNEFSLKELLDEGVIVEFMGTWCPVCKEAAPTIRDFNNKYDNVKIVSISVNETAEEVKTFLDEENISYENYYVSQDDSIMDLYGIRFVPTFFYIDKEGYVQMILGGNPPQEMFDDLYHRIYQ